ncbi:unnamed protein product [Periconia digitata]|uniref:Uncharacterized protein n=1 Tax=Periconia digitata TaxID=1303443 RepID=A0A9W4U492_9PLEO|nr:unnamed protein product [Periconia digitata]
MVVFISLSIHPPGNPYARDQKTNTRNLSPTRELHRLSFHNMSSWLYASILWSPELFFEPYNQV